MNRIERFPYDRKEFSNGDDHAGVFIADETMRPRDVRRGTERVDEAYPSLDDVVEYLVDWP
ncbi:hypothetical protein [Natronorarus salvus]|uniref:hypothetical protein n=1 Tax=Natronorarus salvus TaxID=3117733 RepID=UPI002F267968